MAPCGKLDEGIPWNSRPQVEIPHQEEKYQQNSWKDNSKFVCLCFSFSVFSTPSDQFIIGLPFVVAVFQIISYSLQLCCRALSKSAKSFHSNFISSSILDCRILSVLFSFQICKLFIIKLLLEVLKIINQSS